jgi:hypothetical protein
MAFNTLQAGVELSGYYRIADTGNGLSIVQRVGGTTIPVAATAFDFGTGTNEANALYISGLRAVAATTADNLNLSTLSMGGQTLSLTKVKYVLVAISAPDGTKSLRVGPRGVSNAAQLWAGGTAAGNYETVITDREWKNPYAGWDVTASTADILGIYNPGAGSVTYSVVVIGLD